MFAGATIWLKADWVLWALNFAMAAAFWGITRSPLA